MAKLEELLKAQGFTDEEIAANAALLADPKLRGALETGYSSLESDLTAYKKENDGWKDWHETIGKPLLSKAEQERADARAESAGLRERLKLAEENGFAPTSSHIKKDDPAPTPQGQPSPFDPKAHNLVTKDDVARFADLEGQAIAMTADLNEEYRTLTGGKSIFEYSAEIDGRTLRGMQALRQEAMKANQRLDDYVSKKFDFASKRQAAADARQKASEEAIRADERTKLAAQYGDPNLRPMMPSRDPFIPRGEGGKPSMPWEGDQTNAQRRAERLNRAMTNQMKAGVQ